MSIYLSIGAVQPFADIKKEDVDDEPGVHLVWADGKIVGIRLDDNELVLKLPQLIERFELNPERVWTRLRGDDDGGTIGRRSMHGGDSPR